MTKKGLGKFSDTFLPLSEGGTPENSSRGRQTFLTPVQTSALGARSRRQYVLTAAGRASLVAAARRHRPWESARHRSTGPRTAAGKARSALNGLRNRALWHVVDRQETFVEVSRVVLEHRIVITYANGRITTRTKTVIVGPWRRISIPWRSEVQR
jgi:hypothetical protein